MLAVLLQVWTPFPSSQVWRWGSQPQLLSLPLERGEVHSLFSLRPYWAAGILSDRTSGFLSGASLLREDLSQIFRLPVEFQWHLWHFLVVCFSAVFVVWDVSCGHKFLLAARIRTRMTQAMAVHEWITLCAFTTGREGRERCRVVVRNLVSSELLITDPFVPLRAVGVTAPP